MPHPPKKVLVGDSDEIVRTLISHILRQRGFVVDTLGDHDPVAAHLLESVYDAMVLDIDFDGVRDKIPHLHPEHASRVILTTPRDVSLDGVHAVIRRPIEFEELVATTIRCVAK